MTVGPVLRTTISNGGIKVMDWASANLTSGLISSSMSITLADATRGVQARALANNSVGAGAHGSRLRLYQQGIF